MHISKIIDYVKNEIGFSQEFYENNAFVTLRIEPILKIIENLEQSHKDILAITEEQNKKNKIIDLMADYIGKEDITEIFCDGKIECDENCKTCVKQYFERQVNSSKQ